MLAFAVAVLLASPAAAPAREEAAKTDPSTRACVAVVAKPSPRVARSGRRPWPARHVVRLDIETRLRGRYASSGVELHVLAPGGNLYQKISATPPDASAGTGRRRARRVHARLSVAGTQITQRGLYGTWSIVPYLEGSLVPCGPATTFRLGP